jgi:hypothetical protein
MHQQDSQSLDNFNKKLLPASAGAALGHIKWNRCAVVGNAGHLKTSKYGNAIDQHDVVVRLNQAPTKGAFLKKVSWFHSRRVGLPKVCLLGPKTVSRSNILSTDTYNSVPVPTYFQD